MSTNPLYIFTRYYKGPGTEPANNENNKRLLWEYEQRWTENEEERSDDHPRMQEYVIDVLPLFNADNGSVRLISYLR